MVQTAVMVDMWCLQLEGFRIGLVLLLLAVIGITLSHVNFAREHILVALGFLLTYFKASKWVDMNLLAVVHIVTEVIRVIDRLILSYIQHHPEEPEDVIREHFLVELVSTIDKRRLVHCNGDIRRRVPICHHRSAPDLSLVHLIELFDDRVAKVDLENMLGGSLGIVCIVELTVQDFIHVRRCTELIVDNRGR